VAITIHAENQPPQITSAATVVAYNDSVFAYHASAIDPEGFPISWHFSNFPEWMTATDNSIQGTVPKYLFTTSFDVEASDGRQKTTQSVQLTLISLNKPPRITSAAQAVAYQGQLFEYEARATDPEGKPVTFAFTQHPAWLTGSNAVLSGITPENASDTSFVFIANDGDYADTLTVALTVIARNKAPYFISANQAQATENQPFQYVSHGIDPEGQPLVYIFSNYPAWLMPADSILAGTPPNNTASTYFDAILSDGLLADTMRVTLNVIAVNDPPQIQNLTDFSFDSQHEYVIDLDSCAVDADNTTTELSWQIFPGNNNLAVNLNNHIAVFSTTSYLENTDVFFKVQDPQGSAAIQIVRVDITHTSGVERDIAAIPRQFELKPNYPNPFNPETTFTYGLPKSEHIRMLVFDNQGRLVETLIEGVRAAGYHTITWQAEKHTSGVYYFQLQAGDYSQTRKCVLLK
ncbi:T9SS type A sorting domain-containing protein, partial [bacterium]|nr:T9SS type A sorting domain-containing protein [bacterium]